MKPTVVFLDIEMPWHELVFSCWKNIEEFDFEVIFVTAYNEYMLNALRISALDYLLKPVDTEELKNALSKTEEKNFAAGKSRAYKRTIRIIRRYAERTACSKKISACDFAGNRFFKDKRNCTVEALSNYSTFYLISKQKIMVSKTLKEFEPILTMQNFFRVNRSCIVNTDYIVKYKNEDGGMLELQDGSEVGVGPAPQK
jgi:two-component system LytT family response regulator